MDDSALKKKEENLIHRLKELESLVVAFSGGVDSSFLLVMAHQVLGDRVLAVTADSIAFPSEEREEALNFTRSKGIRHVLFEADIARLPEFTANKPDRCYHCKKAISESILHIAKDQGIQQVAHAVNIDDLGDYRPGLKAAEELGIVAPLVDVGLNKEEIRLLSREMGLPTWDKPAMACLASRIPYEDSITEEKLKRIEQGEAFLAAKGFRNIRIRHHGPVARIEVEPSAIEKLAEPKLRKSLVEEFRKLGFLYVALDLEGYTTGSMNREIKREE